MTGLFIIAAVFLMLAVLIVPFAKKSGLGSVLGYLVAGVMVGLLLRQLAPYLGFDSSKALVEELKHLTEFGVVLMLFLIGLEMRPTELWNMKGAIFGMGGIQVLATTAAIAAVCSLLGLNWQASTAIGLMLALSSTAIIMQTLNEKSLINTKGGQTSFSVLLFQDIAVIPMIALMPLLGNPEAALQGGHVIDLGLPSWAQPVLGLVAVIAIYLFSRYAVEPLFRYIAASRLREIFTTAALGLVTFIAAVMSLFGLSPALGVFMAGVILSESEYRHELESTIEPFKGLLLGLFFMTVGAAFDFVLFAEMPGEIIALALGLIVLKAVILMIVGKLFKVEWSQNLLFCLALAQGGEFAFVLVGEAVMSGVFDSKTSNVIKLVVAISMVLTPLLFIVYEKLIAPRFMGRILSQREPDKITEHGEIVVAGFGRFSQIIVRLLAYSGFKSTILDNDPDHINLLRSFGWKVFYGDASRIDLLVAAGIEKAKLLIIGIDDVEKSIELANEICRQYPNLPVLVRARDRTHAYELINLGAQHVYRETFDASLKVGEDALKLLGFRAFEARRARLQFSVADEMSLRKLATIWKEDREKHIDVAKQVNEEIYNTLKSDLSHIHQYTDDAWDTVKP